MSTEKYGWSLDQEDFDGDCATREEAEQEARSELMEQEGCDMGTVWTCKQEPVEIKVRGTRVIEQVEEDVYEEVGDVSDGWLGMTSYSQDDDLTAILTATFKEWLKKHGLEPTFWKAVDVKEHVKEPEGKETDE